MNRKLYDLIDRSTIEILNDDETELHKCEVTGLLADCYEVNCYDNVNTEPVFHGWVSSDIITAFINGELTEFDEHKSIKEILEDLRSFTVSEKLLGAKPLEKDEIAKAYIPCFTVSNGNKYVAALVYDGTDSYIGTVTFSPYSPETRWDFCDKEDYKDEFADVKLVDVEEEIRSQLVENDEYKDLIYTKSKLDAWNKFMNGEV